MLKYILLKNNTDIKIISVHKIKKKKENMVMKKFTSKLLMPVMVLVLVVGLVACGGKKYSSVSDYLNADEVKSQLSEAQKSLEGSGISVEVTAEGEKMVYTYNCAKLTKSDELVTAMEAQMAKADSTFQNAANEMKKFVDVKNGQIEVTYLDSAGETICSKTYTAQ